MEADLGLVGNQYLTAVSILFVGYILGQLPASTLALSTVVRGPSTNICRHDHDPCSPFALHVLLDVHLGHCQWFDWYLP